MFTFSQGRPIAKIIGGSLNNKILSIKTEDSKCCPKCNERCLKRRCCKNCCLHKSLDYDSDEDDYDDEIVNGRILELDDGHIIQIPNIETREVAYIAGPSGSGKSTYAAEYAAYLKKIFPEKDLFVFSRKDHDEPLDKLKPIRIKIDDSLVESPIDLTQELSDGAIVVFDDVNTILDDKQKKAVDKLMSDIMEVGRSYGIYIIITNHLVIPSEKKVARTIMNELHTLTIFPKSGSAQQIRYALKTYFGLNNKQVDIILKLPSRWVTISKSYPMYVLFEKGAFIL